MSAISALKGYRTQFLYSLHYMLGARDKSWSFRLEGREDLDVEDVEGGLLRVIQVKNLTSPLTTSDLLHAGTTCFAKRLLGTDQEVEAVVVSYGPVSGELKKWKSNPSNHTAAEKTMIRNYGLSEADWTEVKMRTQFIEIDESDITQEVFSMLTKAGPVDPLPTAENLLFYLQWMAEKQSVITHADLFKKIEQIAQYLSERIALTQQYGIYLNPLHLISIDHVDEERLRAEFYFGTSSRYEHVLFGLDVAREDFIEKTVDAFTRSNIVILHGASGQGKTTLSYRYAKDHAPGSLTYELNLQNDPIATRQAIQAILSVTRHLQTPVLFLTHVTPGTTQWLQVAEAFAHYSNFQMLVTIREEDWYRAAGESISFSHTDVELQLQKTEAKQIYAALDARSPVLHFTDFEEAWISLNENVPLLEFVYTVTHGDSLINRLRQQVRALAPDNDSIGLLRLISLADAFDAKLDLEKLVLSDDIKWTIEKLEKEYLVRLSEDRKYLSGLHPVRSKLLLGILFDDYVYPKSVFVFKCLGLMRENDYLRFLLHCLHEKIITPEELINHVKQNPPSDWSLYRALLRSLLWAGIRDYIGRNQEHLDQCYDRYGDTWILIANISHAGTLDLAAMHGNLPFNKDISGLFHDLSERLEPITASYGYVTVMIQQVTLPSKVPAGDIEWLGLAEALFWLPQFTTDNKIPVLETQTIEHSFNQLPLTILSKLMLGMFTHGGIWEEQRLQHCDAFTQRLRERYRIPLLRIDHEIHVHFFVDLLKEGDAPASNEGVMEVIDLLRDAYPDKERYCTQAYGHQFESLLPHTHDNSTKHISRENLPLNEWTSLNALTIWLYAFNKRPKDWPAYHAGVNDWEKETADTLKSLLRSIQSFKKNGSLTELIAMAILMEKTNYRSIQSPQSVNDPLGEHSWSGTAQGRKTKTSSGLLNLNNQGTKQELLQNRYAMFYKALSDLRFSLEAFFRQCSASITARILALKDKNQKIDEYAERLTLVNLFDALERLRGYNKEKEKYFLAHSAESNNVIDYKDLLKVTVGWKSLLDTGLENHRPSHADQTWMKTARNDFERRLRKNIRSGEKKENCTIRFIQDMSTQYKPVFIVNVLQPSRILFCLKTVYEAIADAVGKTAHFSLKQLMLQEVFPEFRVIFTIEGLLLQNVNNVFPLHVVRDKSFEELTVLHLLGSPIPEEIIQRLNLDSWQSKYPSFQQPVTLTESFSQLQVLVYHLQGLTFFEEVEMDQMGQAMLHAYAAVAQVKLRDNMQHILDGLSSILNQFPFDPDQLEEADLLYWEALFKIKENFFPTDKGDEEEYSVKVGLPEIKVWSEKLQNAVAAWGIFVFLLNDKILARFHALYDVD